MARALTALTIGPLSPRGDDGVTADVRTFSALGLHGAAVVTAVGTDPLDAKSIASQLEAVLATARVDAVKLACPADEAALEVIAGALARFDVQNLVLDPGDAVSNSAVMTLLKERLMPRALVVTANVEEAASLTGLKVETWEDMREAAQALYAMGAANVVIKGGKLHGALATDLLFDGKDYRDYTAERVHLTAVPGAGSTFAAALAAMLAKGETVQHSGAAAKAYVTKALQDSYDLGERPVLHHFYRYWRPSAPE